LKKWGATYVNYGLKQVNILGTDFLMLDTMVVTRFESLKHLQKPCLKYYMSTKPT